MNRLHAGHLNNPALVSFLKRARSSLKPDSVAPADLAGRPDYVPPRPLIIVKENVCDDAEGGKATEVLDEDDSSLTR
jgi:protein N-terminal methyltransferase